MTAPSRREVGESVPERKLSSDRARFPYSAYVLGGLSLRLAPWFIRSGIGPNAITLSALGVLVLALAAIVAGGSEPALISVGGLLLHLVLVFDNIDGTVARFEERTSRLGAFLDSLLTWIHYALLPLCLGLALAASDPEWWQADLGWEPAAWVWIAAGVARSVAYLLTVVVGENANALLACEGYEERLGSPRALVVLRAVLEGEVLLLILAPLLGLVGLLHLGYAALYLLVLAAALARNLTDLAREDRTP